MERALLAALSPNEEITLRRISYGIVAARDLNKSDIERLKALALIRRRGSSFVLTLLGEHRVAQLPNNVLGGKPLTSEEHVRAMAKALGVKLRLWASLLARA